MQAALAWGSRNAGRLLPRLHLNCRKLLIHSDYPDLFTSITQRAIVVTSLKMESSACVELWSRILDRAEELRLCAGDRLPSVRELAVHLGANSNLVRNAILAAESRGAVRVMPRVGVFLEAAPSNARFTVKESVTDVEAITRAAVNRGPINVLHVMEARRSIEVELVGLAAERRRLDALLPARQLLDAMLQMPPETAREEYVTLDYRFHVELARQAGNDVLAAMQKTLTDLLASHFVDVPGSPDRRSDSERLHIAIYSAIVEGDAAKARSAMHEHLSNVYDYLLTFVQRPPETCSRKKK